MTIPIFHDGGRIGTLETRREGAYTLFEARCAPLSGVRRLWVFGEEGKHGCLGVMEPACGELRLKRKLSRAALRGFPDPIAYAGFAEEEKRPEPPKSEPRASAAGEEGFFIIEDGARCLALRCALEKIPPGARVREIGGEKWLLFRC